MSWQHESQLDPRDPGQPATTSPQWLLIGYLLGLIAMSPAPLLYYWLFAPAGALLLAALCVLAGATHPRFRAMAPGALIAATFGLTTTLVFFLAVANQ